MYNRRWLIHALVPLGVLVILTAFANKPVTSPAYAATAQPTAAATAAPTGAATAEATTDFSDPTALIPEGKVTFTVNKTGKQTLHFEPGTEGKLTLTDAKGFTWTLDVPADALTIRMDISMSPMIKASLDGAKKNPIFSGVQFEPDGLEFYDPPTLTVTSKQKKQILLITAHQDGTSPIPMLPVQDDPGTVYITHFSGGFITDADLYPASFNKAYQWARDFLHYEKGQPLSYSANIPSFIPSCDKPQKDADYQQADDAAYYSIANPELVLADSLLGELKRLPPDDMANKESDVMDIEISLKQRILDKVLLAIKDARKESDHGAGKYLSLMNMALLAERDLQLTRGGKTDYSAVLDVATDWLPQILDVELGHIINDHDYEKMPFILSVTRQWELAKGNVSKLENDAILQRLDNAMLFKLHLESTLTAQGGFSESFAGDIDLKYTPQSFNLTGSGDIPYTSGTLDNPNSASSIVGLFQKGHIKDTSFPVNVYVIGFDPCIGFAFGADQLGSPTEEWSVTDVTGTTSSVPLPFYYKIFKHDFALDNGKLEFILPIQNKNVQAVNYTGTDKTANYNVVFTIILTHTPKK